MKILSLRLKNINSFKEDIHLDFTDEPLCSASLFAITGPTGSGKTTLLDAICVALYNRTARLDGKGNRSPVNLLSQGTDEGFAEVVFQVDGVRYLAEWRVRRKRKGDIKSEAKLIRADTGELITNRRTRRKSQDLADMSVEEAVTRILGMDFGAFKRSIILAQGEFASFLKADAEKKREILEATTGMDLYEVLKENLNQRIRLATEEYKKAEAALEAIPAASPEEIAAAKAELAGIEESLRQLYSKKAGLEKEKEEEQRRVDAFKTLKENRKRQQELMSRKDEVEHIQREIERAEKAANIRSEMESFDSEKEHLENVQTELDEAKKELEDAKALFDDAKLNYEASSQAFERARIEAEEKRKTYNEAAIYESQGMKLHEEARKKLQKADALKVKLEQISSLIQQKKDEISALEMDAADDRQFLEQNPLPEAVESLLQQASEIAALLGEKEKTLQQLKEALHRADTERQEREKELDKRTREKKTFEMQRDDFAAQLDDIITALQPLTEEGNKDYWHSIKSAWDRVHVAGGRFIESYDQLSRIFDSMISLTNSQQEFNDLLHLYKDRMELINQELSHAKEKVKQCEEEEKQVHITHQAVILRSEHLIEGTPCPVCGSTEHPWAGKTEPDIQELIEKASEKVQAAKSELEAIMGNFDAAVQELASLARDKISACEHRIEEIDSLTRERIEAENNLRLLDQQIQANNSLIESLNRQKENIQQEMDNLTSQIKGLEDEISTKRSQFLDIIPHEFSQEPPESAVEKFKTLISSVRECARRLEQNSRIFTEHSTSIQENTNRLEEDTVRYNQLLAAAEQYKEEANKLLGLAMEMTGGLSVEAARSGLEADLREKEEQRNTLLDMYRHAETKLAEARARVAGLETDLDRALTKYAEAESRYMQAIEVAGFSSDEEHRASFRDQSWLEEKRQIVQQYQKDVHTVEENIKIQEAVFTGKPFNPDDLQDILQKESTIDVSIKEKTSLMGEIKEKIRILTENLQKRQEQEKRLEDTKKEMDRWLRLAQVMPANSLRDFALKTMFDLLIRFANRQLSDITSRYALKVKDMKDMVVIDRWNAGEERPVETLSGGESFLVSLSLALALSELSSGRSRLESLFLDEGFGTLDTETLDAALYALESLRLSGRTIGVISHIDQLTRRIPVRIEVRKMGNGTSRIQVRG